MSPTRYVVEYMLRRSPVASSLRWVVRNVATEAFWRRSKERYLMLRCGDFTAEPQRTIRRILELVREETIPLPHVAEHEVTLGVNQNIWGNPSRFQTGTVEIRPDRGWASHIKPGDRRLSAFFNFPLTGQLRVSFSRLWMVRDRRGRWRVGTLKVPTSEGHPGGTRTS